MSLLQAHIATRYVAPLREGGSLPAIVETEGDGLYVVKFRGAGQGAKALIAELLAGELARQAELPIPDVSLVGILPVFGRSEPDPEIQALLRASHGVNVGLRYLDGAFNFDPSAALEYITPTLAERVVWFDAFITNPDRSARNPNLLIWNRQPWLIDHGAALYVHHDWANADEKRAQAPFTRISDHVLLTHADNLASADTFMRDTITESSIAAAIAAIPDELLSDPISGYSDSPDEVRMLYQRYLTTRLHASPLFVAEAERARDRVRLEPPRPVKARR